MSKPRVAKDFRVLEVEHPATDDLLDYVAQHVDETWPLLHVACCMLHVGWNPFCDMAFIVSME